VPESERLLVWADLLAAHPSTASRAKELLLEISKKYPGTPRSEELLGHIAWMTQQSDEARIHWAKAVESGSRDFESVYRLALLLHQGGAPPSEVIALMEKAIEVKPDCDEAIYNLGVIKYGEGQYEGASQILLSLRNVAPEQAYTYYSVLAYCDMKMRTFDRAKAFLLKAAESARTADEQAENSRMLRFAAVRAD
jgi:tetratricopeptide (TPR) repeat protein